MKTVAALLVVASAFVGSAAAASTPADPCVTVSKTAAAAAMGVPVKSAVPSTLGHARVCTFNGSMPNTAVLVTARRFASPAEAHARFAKAISQITARLAPPKRVVGIGDEATSTASTVYVRKSESLYVFTVPGPPNDASIARAVALAKSTMVRVN